MDEVQFDEEGIKFKYLSNWKEQNKEMVAPNCIKALVKVVEGNPSTITVYKNDAGEVNAVAEIEEPFKENFKKQGWNIVESRILNLNGMPVYNIIAHSVIGEDGKVKENIEELAKNAKKYYEENFKKELFFEKLLKEMEEK